MTETLRHAQGERYGLSMSLCALRTVMNYTRPLINGATLMMYEGAPNYPYPDRWWQMVENYGISILYTSPTAIRGLMRFGEAWPNRHDLSSLRILGSVGAGMMLVPARLLRFVRNDTVLGNLFCLRS